MSTPRCPLLIQRLKKRTHTRTFSLFSTLLLFIRKENVYFSAEQERSMATRERSRFFSSRKTRNHGYWTRLLSFACMCVSLGEINPRTTNKI